MLRDLQNYIFLDGHLHNLVTCYRFINRRSLTINAQKLRNNIERLFSLGLSAVFTDHGTLEPYKILQRNYFNSEKILDSSYHISNYGRHLKISKGSKSIYIICGEELRTKVNNRATGHILAYGLKDPIKDFMTPQATIEAIKSQKGVIIAAHIFNYGGLRIKYLKQLYNEFDAVELTAADILNITNKRAIRFIQKQQHIRKINYIIDSDAHLIEQIGKGFWGFPRNLIEKKTDMQFLSNLRNYLRDSSSYIPCNMGRYKLKDATLHYPRRYLELFRHYNGRKVRH